MTSAEAARAIQPALDHLIEDDVIAEKERQLWLVRPPENRIAVDVDALAVGVTNRMRVRFGIEADAAHRSAIRQMLEWLVLSRGWDLAASLASAKRSDTFELAAPMEGALRRFGNAIPSNRQHGTREAVRDLLDRPNSREAEILTRLARLSSIR